MSQSQHQKVTRLGVEFTAFRFAVRCNTDDAKCALNENDTQYNAPEGQN